jgi:hypothetical protein
MTRREFLIVAGCGCAGLVIAGTGCARISEATAAAACPYGYRFDAYPGQCYRFIDSNGSGYCDFSEPLITTTTVTTSVSQTDSAAPTVTATTTEETRVVLCDRGCRAPGQCGRFVDSDGTGVCDLTEGIVISPSNTAATGLAATATPAATATTATGSATTSSATATTAATATPVATSVALVVLCDRGCSYPGNCGRYTDNDGTGKCDLSEGIPADQAAAYGGVSGGGRGRGGRGG